MSNFFCDQCGLCCKKLSNSPMYKDLDRGDGVCIHFNETTNLCGVYENRPLKCRVDDMYTEFYQNTLTIEEFHQLNYEACNILKKEERL